MKNETINKIAAFSISFTKKIDEEINGTKNEGEILKSTVVLFNEISQIVFPLHEQLLKNKEVYHESEKLIKAILARLFLNLSEQKTNCTPIKAIIRDFSRSSTDVNITRFIIRHAESLTYLVSKEESLQFKIIKPPKKKIKIPYKTLLVAIVIISSFLFAWNDFEKNTLSTSEQYHIAKIKCLENLQEVQARLKENAYADNYSYNKDLKKLRELQFEYKRLFR